MRVGKENKHQVYLLAALCVVIMAIASFELYGALGSKPVAPSAAPAAGSGAAGHASALGRGMTNIRLEPTLRIGEIARTERTEYSAIGRNIFSVESVPVHIEHPIAPARPAEAAALAAPIPERPQPQAIDIKYLGYTQDHDKVCSAILARGNDSLTARSGDIVFHRYKIGLIQPASVEVTDLSDDRNQTIGITEK